MAKRIDFPLGGSRRKAERQRADRQRKRELDQVTEAFEQRSRALERPTRPWLDALKSCELRVSGISNPRAAWSPVAGPPLADLDENSPPTRSFFAAHGFKEVPRTTAHPN